MNTRQLDSDEIYQSLGQRIARQIHLYKALFRSKERPRVEWLSQFIPEGGVILDIGAHFGYFSKEFSRLHHGSCSIIAFEPMAYNAGILAVVTAKLPNVTVVNKALSDSDGTLDLIIPVKEQGKIGPGLAHFGVEKHRDYIVQPVETLRLDDYVSENKLTRVDFIKIDVEGAELPALMGAALTIERYKPVIFTEVCRDFTKRLGHMPEDLFDFLANAGYSAHRVNEQNLTMRPVLNYEDVGDYLFIYKSNTTS